jgi:hypothetical protein
MTGLRSSQFLAESVIRMSGLEAWTEAGKHAFGLAYQATTGRYMNRTFDTLPKRLRRSMEAYGITANDWDVMRSATAHQPQGRTKFLRPTDIAALDHPDASAVAEKYLGMIIQETQRAVPEGTIRGRALVLDRNRPGTISGELVRSAMQFKSFGVTLMLLHGQAVHRALAAGETRHGLGYAFGLLAGLTVGGAVVVQLKSLKDGKDPRPMNDPAFWAAAAAQGGGFGLLGDFAMASTNRFGGGLAGSILGPTVATMADAATAIGTNVSNAAKGKKTDLSKDVAKIGSSLVPGSSLWYLTLAWKRYVADNLQRLADPEAAKAFRDARMRERRDRKTDFWWPPGETRPERSPNFGNITTR